jgi:hypothetical protein
MNTKDFQSKITSVKLAENLVKQFGVKVNVGSYDREQLEDIRNKLRTKIFQQEGSAKFNDLLTNETYQKNKAMLELLNTRIKEMLGEQMKQLRDKMDQLTEAKKSKPDFLDLDKDGNRTEPMKKAAKDAKVKEGAKPDYIDLDKDGNKKETMKKAAKDAKVKEGFPTVADAKARAEKEKTTGKFDKKETGTGTVYTRKSNTFTDGGDDSDVKTAKKKAKGVKEGMKHAKDCDCKECMGMAEAVRVGALRPGGLVKRPEWQGGRDAMAQQVKNIRANVRDPNNQNARHLPQKGSAMLGHTMTPAVNSDEREWETRPKARDGKGVALPLPEAGGGEKGAKIARAQRQKMKKAGQLEESQFKHNVRFVNESIGFLLQEDEEAKAKTITAAGDIVNDFTGWMQRIGQYQTKAIIELADSIRADFGAAESEAFKQKVSPALSASLEMLTQQREILSNAVAELAGEAVPDAPMGMEPDVGMDAGLDQSAPDEMNPEPAGDEFAASDAAAGGDETAGRGLRENRQQRRARRLAEQHSILSKLAQ